LEMLVRQVLISTLATEKSATKGAITSQGLGLFRVTRFVIGFFFNGWLA
jgi:hypothetical protein